MLVYLIILELLSFFLKAMNVTVSFTIINVVMHYESSFNVLIVLFNAL